MLCRHCKFSHPDLKELLKHYRLHHWHHVDGLLQCVFIDCVCTFKTKSALKTHLSRSHLQSQPKRRKDCATIKCDICEFNEVCDEKTFFNHLTGHLNDKISVTCPFINCTHKATIPGTFRSHRSRSHKNQSLKDFKPSVLIANGNRLIEHSEEEVLSDGRPDSPCRSVDGNVDITQWKYCKKYCTYCMLLVFALYLQFVYVATCTEFTVCCVCCWHLHWIYSCENIEQTVYCHCWILHWQIYV